MYQLFLTPILQTLSTTIRNRFHQKLFAAAKAACRDFDKSVFLIHTPSSADQLFTQIKGALAVISSPKI